MRRTLLKSKIHRATVTDANLHYVGSITIDRDLMDAANMVEYEKVAIVDINNGERLETYVIEGPRGSGAICLNGAAARKVAPGDLVIIISYCELENEECENWDPIRLFVDANNKVMSLEGGTTIPGTENGQTKVA
jgi:aspartate 1-decarboxylase